MAGISVKTSEELENRVKAAAEEAGLSVSDYVRMVIEKELDPNVLPNAPTNIYPILFSWWERTQKMDGGQLVGAKARAEAIGMTFDGKFAMTLKMMLDQSLL